MTATRGLRVLVFQSDSAQCFKLRILQKYNELKRFGVEMDHTPIFPSLLGEPGPSFQALINQISRYDIVCVQRLTQLPEISTIVNACFYLGKACYFETDDDYCHLERHNPCYFSTALGDPLLEKARQLSKEGRQAEVDALLPQLEPIRLQGLANYKKALSLFDAVTVTTDELASTILPYNKNVHVFPNMMQRVFWEKDVTIEDSTMDGKMVRIDRMGMSTVPSYCFERDPKKNFEVVLKDGAPVRHLINSIGYSGTLSHYADWMTIDEGWNRLAEKWAPSAHFIYIGDPWFYRRQRVWSGPQHSCNETCPPYCPQYNPEGDGRPTRRIHIQETDPDLYLLNMRNAKCAVAPLAPTIFNMAKSDLKAMESAVWGNCPILPRYITYTRTFVEGQTAMFYSNQEEFYNVANWLFENPAQREKIGANARQYIYQNRLEKDHIHKYYEFLINLYNSKKPLVQLKPNKEKVA